MVRWSFIDSIARYTVDCGRDKNATLWHHKICVILNVSPEAIFQEPHIQHFVLDKEQKSAQHLYEQKQ